MVFDHGLEFQNSVGNGCHNLTMLCLNLNDISTITVKGVDYRCIVYGITKYEAINLVKNYVLDDRGCI